MTSRDRCIGRYYIEPRQYKRDIEDEVQLANELNPLAAAVLSFKMKVARRFRQITDHGSRGNSGKGIKEEVVKGKRVTALKRDLKKYGRYY